MALDPRDFLRSRKQVAEPAPLAGTRAESVQRLQIGAIGIGAMVLLLGLADIVSERAQQTQAEAVPEAAPTVEPRETSAPSDPLADAGVVPELSASPTPTASPAPTQPQRDVPLPQNSNAPLE